MSSGGCAVKREMRDTGFPDDLKLASGKVVKIAGTQVLGAQQTAQADTGAQTQDTLTDSSGGTADTTVNAVSGSGADATINNNFADLAAQLAKIKVDVAAIRTTQNAALAKLRTHGLIAT